MNYIILLILLAIVYYIVNLNNKSIYFLCLLLGFYIYYESILPDTFLTIPYPLKKETFEFKKLDKLINEYNKGSLEEDIKLHKEIQKEINTIYFSFPNHLHSHIDDYFYRHYGFIKNT